MFTEALSLAVTASCLFLLRHRGEGSAAQGTWKMPGCPWIPAAFVLILLGVAADVTIRQTNLALAGPVIVALGVPLYFLMRRACRERGA